jgi:hypothetical protein
LEVDWEAVLPKVRPALMDKSKERRTIFIARYLAVTPESKSSVAGALSEELIRV